MFPKGQMANIMRQAQQMNDKMQAVQQQIAHLEGSGEAAAGLVKIGLSGDKSIKSIRISDEAMDDREMLEDLIIAAHNNALADIEKQIKHTTQQATQSMGLPPGLGSLLG